jgi:hypothetical protein
MSHRNTSPLVLVELALLAAITLWLLAGIVSNPGVLALVCFIGAVPLLFVVLPPLVAKVADGEDRVGVRLPGRRRD